MSEQLCEAADPRTGQRVLDVATGTGCAGLAGCCPSVLPRHAEMLDVDCREGDAETPCATDSFEAVRAVLGVILAPNEEQPSAS